MSSAIEVTVSAPIEVPASEPVYTVEYLIDTYSKSELQGMAREKGAVISGTKLELANRIMGPDPRPKDAIIEDEADITEENLQALNKDALREMAVKYGVKSTGRKDEIIERILNPESHQKKRKKEEEEEFVFSPLKAVHVDDGAIEEVDEEEEEETATAEPAEVDVAVVEQDAQNEAADQIHETVEP